MNRSAAVTLAKIMAAFGRGEVIQYRPKSYPTGKWVDAARPDATLSFNWHTFEYRIKPTPQEFFITVYGDPRETVLEGQIGNADNVGMVYSSAAAARKGGMNGARVFKVVEVLPE